MGTKTTNHWVERLPEPVYNAFRDRLRVKVKKTTGTQEKLKAELGFTDPVLRRRINDPDAWNLGQLRTLRGPLKMTKEELISLIRPLL